MQDNQTNGPAIQPANNPVPTPEQPKNNSFLIILLSILLIISVAISGFFAYQTQVLVKELNNLKTNQKPTSVNTTEPTVEPIATNSAMTVDLTAGWKTYTSDNQLDIPDSYFSKFTNLKNDLPKSFTFKYPSTWKIVKFSSSEYQKTVNLGYQLYKSDPAVNCGNGGGGGPCDNSADIQFRFGMVDSTIKNFDQTFWGDGFPIDHETNLLVNGTNVVQAYSFKLSQYPEVSLFKVAPSGQFFIRSEFFPNGIDNTKYSNETINEINQILSTFKFTK
jgi:hypothetical protein